LCGTVGSSPEGERKPVEDNECPGAGNEKDEDDDPPDEERRKSE
jgi:hypothetical protein